MAEYGFTTLFTTEGIVIEAAPGELKRGQRKAVKEGMRRSVKHWHRAFFPRKFEGSAYNRYQLKPRTVKYSRRKRRKKGHDRAFEYSGQFKEMSRNPIRLSGTARQVKGRVASPWYVRMIPKTRDAPMLTAEAVKTIAAEARDMARIVAVTVRQLLGKIKKKTRLKT